MVPAPFHQGPAPAQGKPAVEQRFWGAAVGGDHATGAGVLNNGGGGEAQSPEHPKQQAPMLLGRMGDEALESAVQMMLEQGPPPPLMPPGPQTSPTSLKRSHDTQAQPPLQ